MLNRSQKILLGYLILVIVYWVILHANHLTDGIYNYLYSFLFSLIPLIGGIVGMFQSRVWGGWKSHVGKAVLFTSFGLFLWGAGSMVWSYYNIVAKIDAPYPSLADFGFAPSIFFYGLGAIYLSGATGAKFALRASKWAKFFAVAAPLLILIASYYTLVTIARGGVVIPAGESILKTVLDIAYPLGDFVSLTVAIVVSGLSFRYLGGRFKFDVISIWIGLGVMYFADFVFSYTTTVNTFYNGDWGDLMLTLGLFFLAFGALGFYKLRDNQ